MRPACSGRRHRDDAAGAAFLHAGQHALERQVRRRQIAVDRRASLPRWSPQGPGLTGLPHAFATRMSIGPDSASIRRRIFSMPAKLVRSAGSCIAWPPAGPLTEVWRPEQPGAMLVLEAADLAEAGAVAAGLPLASAAQVTADLIPLHLQTA